MHQVEAFYPSIKLFQMMGMISFSVGKNYEPKNNRKFLTNSVFLTVCSVLATVQTVFDYEKYNNSEKTGIGSSVDFLQLLFMKFGGAVILLESLIRNKKVKKFFEELSEFDNMRRKNY